MKSPRILVIDNYDSFTYNLVQLLGTLGADPVVLRNDEKSARAIARMPKDGILVSPGPGTPGDSGVSREVIRDHDGKVPLLGVCLGHQCLGEVYGAEVVRGERILHGKTSPILHTAAGLFEGLSNPFEATRYHSLQVPRSTLPGDLQVVAWTPEDEIMAVRSRRSESWGVQFHPESILTVEGPRLLSNFLDLCRD